MRKAKAVWVWYAIGSLAACDAQYNPGQDGSSNSSITSPSTPARIIPGISGVVRGVDGAPVVGAGVSGGTGPHTVTDAAGMFTLPSWTESPARASGTTVAFRGLEPYSPPPYASGVRFIFAPPTSSTPAPNVPVDLRLDIVPELATGAELTVTLNESDFDFRTATEFECGPCKVVRLTPDVPGAYDLAISWETANPRPIAALLYRYDAALYDDVAIEERHTLPPSPPQMFLHAPASAGEKSAGDGTYLVIGFEKWERYNSAGLDTRIRVRRLPR